MYLVDIYSLTKTLARFNAFLFVSFLSKCDINRYPRSFYEAIGKLFVLCKKTSAIVFARVFETCELSEFALLFFCCAYGGDLPKSDSL